MEDTIHFNEKDSEKVVEYLNLVAKHAKFEMNTQELIKYFKLLSYMQQELLPKVKSNVFEVKRIVEPEKKEE